MRVKSTNPSTLLRTFTGMQATRIPYAQTNRFSTLVTDYLAGNPSITSFFGELPTLAGFKNQVAHRRSFSAASREVLVQRVKDQYKTVVLGAEDAKILHERINLLAKPNTFTVTTGHQLCLFTGPLYTVYKILHVIRLAEELSTSINDVTVLPIFWMATEDHDFDEVNHIRHNGHKLVWHHEPGNAVGRIETDGIKPVLDDLKHRLPKGMHAEALLSDLEAAYLNQPNLACATRALVHKWFGHLGILCLDGDDAELKKAMIPAFTQELTEQRSYAAVQHTSAALRDTYDTQVTPREINVFYLFDGMRSRIVREANQYQALSGQASWSQADIEAELQAHPERFSPNVLLRPLYQETILPNLGYIGGGGEVAYWAQLKDMFAAFEVPFPIVVLRQSVQLVPKRIKRKLEKLAIHQADVFTDYHALSKTLVHRKCGNSLDLDNARKRADELYNALSTLAAEVDVTLLRHIEAQKTRVLRGLDVTEKKLFRAAKKNEGDVLRMLRESLDVLFPGGALQERHDNILAHWLAYGPNLIAEIMGAIQPLDFTFMLLEEE